MAEPQKPPTPEQVAAESAAAITAAETKATEAAAKQTAGADAERLAIAAQLPGLRGLADAALTDSAFGLEVLIERGRLIVEPEGAFIVASDGTKSPASVEALRATAEEISPLLAKAKGKPGPGGREPRELGSGGLDMSRVGDRAYWKDHKKEIIAARGRSS